MLRGTRARPATKTMLAAAVLLGFAAVLLLGLSAGSAAAATGGAGVAAPTPKRTVEAPAAQRSGPALRPLAAIPQLAAHVRLRRVSRRAVSAATLLYRSQASGPLAVRVDVVRVADGLSVFSDARTVAPGALQRIRWTGRTGDGLALDGRYQLRIALAGATSASGRTSVAGGGATGGGAAAELPEPPPGSTRVRTFTFVGAAFPVRGRHWYSGGAGRFGAGRAGHVHQGQDVMARCGTPVVAARGGRVIARTYQALAGNYLVIQDPLTGQSTVYDHLRAPASVRRGQRVATGQAVGVVGQTGDATACHLHFEIWTAPGWYRGGEPIDPFPALKRWDRLS